MGLLIFLNLSIARNRNRRAMEWTPQKAWPHRFVFFILVLFFFSFNFKRKEIILINTKNPVVSVYQSWTGPTKVIQKILEEINQQLFNKIIWKNVIWKKKKNCWMFVLLGVVHLYSLRMKCNLFMGHEFSFAWNKII